ncbi:MAG: multicopper oxidase family protein, partial [Acidimicrobiia bacterium]
AWPRGDAAAGGDAGAGEPGGAGHGSHGGAAGEWDDEAMNRHHEEGIQQFLDNVDSPITEGVGATELEPRVVDGVREYEITCTHVDWEVTPGTRERAMTYNGMVPGPTLRAVEGERVRVRVRNELEQSTVVHFHGQQVPNAMDGVSFITQPPIRPGEEFVYEFVARPFGTHMYHSHHNSAEQVGAGLFGMFLVEPKDRGAEPAYDRDHLYVLNDVLGGFTINGKGFPATQAYTARQGERVRFRFVNVGQMAHPIHLHGMPMEVVARDGFPLPQPYRCDTVNVAPGERWDAIVRADNPGTWAFHCHILTHAEGPDGMFGMVTALVVE